MAIAALEAFAGLITGNWASFAKALLIMTIGGLIRFGGTGTQAISLRLARRSARTPTMAARLP